MATPSTIKQKEALSKVPEKIKTHKATQ